MGLPRPNRTKYGISLAQIASLTGESLSSLKRQSANHSDAFRAKVARIIAGEFQPEATEPDRIDQLEDVIWKVHFTICRISWPDVELRQKLEPVLALTRPIIEAI
jgi:hypothetical protein